jgi:hypothetical protein
MVKPALIREVIDIRPALFFTCRILKEGVVEREVAWRWNSL